jgi:hypothetical protein
LVLLPVAANRVSVKRLRRNPATKQFVASMKPFSFASKKPGNRGALTLLQLIKQRGSIMWTLISILYRAYCRQRLLEIRKYHLAG